MAISCTFGLVIAWIILPFVLISKLDGIYSELVQIRSDVSGLKNLVLFIADQQSPALAGSSR